MVTLKSIYNLCVDPQKHLQALAKGGEEEDEEYEVEKVKDKRVKRGKVNIVSKLFIKVTRGSREGR